MAAREEREGKNATREEEDEAGEVAAPSKLKLVGHYAMLGFGPLVAVVALVVAVMALGGSRSGEEQSAKAVAATGGQEKNLEAIRNDLDRLRLSMAQERNGQSEERKKQDELLAKIVQNVSQMQAKLKISPTLEQQLQPAPSAPAAAPAAAAPAPKAGAAPVPATGATGSEKKLGAQAQAIKEAIEKFNKQ